MITATKSEKTREANAWALVVLACAALALILSTLTGCGEDKAQENPQKETVETKTTPLKPTSCETGAPMTVNDPSVITYVKARTDHLCAIVLAIMPEYLGWIESGQKTFEYRKSHPSDGISHILFYDNGSDELVAVADVVASFAGAPQLLADLTWKYSGTTAAGLMSYYGDRPVGFAIQLKNYRRLKKPLSLVEARKLDSAFRKPKSYTFIDRHEAINKLIEAEVRSYTPPRR